MKLKAHLALLAVALIYGANYTIAKNVLDQSYLTPNGFILLRVIAGAFLFYIIHSIFISEKIEKKDILILFLCGVFGVATNQLAFFKGLSLTSPIHASLIMVSTPILVIIISSIYLREAITVKKLIGIAIGLIGAGILIYMSSGGNDKMSSVKGDLYVLLNASSYGVYLVIVKKLMLKYHPFTVMKWVFGVGLILVLPFGAADLTKVNWADFPLDIWLAIIYVLLLTTFGAYVLNAFALATVNPTTASAYIYLQPVVATTIAVLFYNDVLSLGKIFCAMLIFTGVYLVSFGKAKAKLPQ